MAQKYIQEKTNISLNYVCGESSEEIMAWCYASYFTWKKQPEFTRLSRTVYPEV